MTKAERSSLPKGPGGLLQAQPARPTLVDRWILSRLAFAAASCNEGFESYDFPKATTAIYNFWLYDLCDVYLESIKPVFLCDNEEQKICCQKILYCCLDSGLRLMSPFMPFLTEELYQRLPHRKETCPESIAVASYPSRSHWCNEDLEKEVEQMMEIVRTIRSMKEEYLNTKAKAPVYIRAHNEATRQVASKLNSVVATLSNSPEVQLMDSETPAPGGCGVQLIGDRCEVLLLLKGIVDFNKEVEKLKTKQQKTSQQLEKLVQSTQMDNYSTKVPEKVQQQNTEKIDQLTMELEKLAVTLITFNKAAAE